jgi:tRNA (guanine-N7-)-methyltransferase
MSNKNKLQRFAENKTFSNMFQLSYEEVKNGFKYQGKWSRDFFGNDNPLVLELACGKGEYTVGLAERYPEKNFIGMDIKGARIWQGLVNAKEKGLSNVAFIRTRIDQIGFYFGKEEVDEIWITFPDPQPRVRDEKRRLTSPQFLKRYEPLLKKDHIIHLKTDNIIFYDYTLDVIKEYGHKLLYSNEDIYGSDLDNEVTQIQTFYEKMWLANGVKIKYLQFQLNKDGRR